MTTLIIIWAAPSRSPSWLMSSSDWARSVAWLCITSAWWTSPSPWLSSRSSWAWSQPWTTSWSCRQLLHSTSILCYTLHAVLYMIYCNTLYYAFLFNTIIYNMPCYAKWCNAIQPLYTILPVVYMAALMHKLTWAEAPGPTPIGGPIMSCKIYIYIFSY